MGKFLRELFPKAFRLNIVQMLLAGCCVRVEGKAGFLEQSTRFQFCVEAARTAMD